MLLEKSYSLLSVFYTRSRRLSRLAFFANNIFRTQVVKNDNLLIFLLRAIFPHPQPASDTRRGEECSERGPNF